MAESVQHVAPTVEGLTIVQEILLIVVYYTTPVRKSQWSVGDADLRASMKTSDWFDSVR